MVKEKAVIKTMKIEDIRTIERFIFWFERVAILTQVFVFPSPHYLLCFAALLLLITNTIFITLFVERQIICGFFFEPEAIFYIERPATLAVILHYFVPGGCACCAIIGLVILILTNYVMLNRYYNIRDLEKQLPSENSLSSEANTNLNAKETRKGDDQEKKNEKDLIKDELLKKKVEFNKEVVGLQEANMGGNFAPAQNSITNNRECLDYLSFWESSNGEKKEALGRNSSPPFETNSSNAMETRKDGNLKKEEAVVEDEGLKEKSEVKAMTGNSVQRPTSFTEWFNDAISECASVLKSRLYIKEEVAGHGEEFETAEDEPPELQGNNKNISASEDSKTENDVQEEQSAVSLTDDFEKNDDLMEEKVTSNERAKREEDEVEENSKNSSASKELKIEEDDQKQVIAMADEVKEAKDEKEGVSGLEGDNQNWEEMQNDLSEQLFDAIESSFDQKKTDEVEEAKDEQAATGNYKSDDDSSWGAEIASSDQKKVDELEEAEHKEEDTSNYDTDESSWGEGQNNLSRKSCASISSSEFFQEQLHEYEGNSLKWEQEKKDLTEKLEVATKFWKQYEENYYKLREEVRVEGTETDELLEDLKTQRSKFIELESKWVMESWNFNAKLDAATETLEFAEESLEWNKEKEYLQTQLDDVTESLEQERHMWEDEKKDLCEMLDVATQSLENYMAIEKGFAEERQKWNQQKNALNATISHADENVQYCQTLVFTYAERCRKLAMQGNENHSQYQDSLNELIAEKDDLSSKLEAATSSTESYKAWYNQSEEHCQYYKTCFEEYEEKCRKLMEDHLNLSSKLYSDSSFAERYKRSVQELEDKCRRLEEEKTDLTAKLCATKASSELYRACLHDLVA